MLLFVSFSMFAHAFMRDNFVRFLMKSDLETVFFSQTLNKNVTMETKNSHLEVDLKTFLFMQRKNTQKQFLCQPFPETTAFMTHLRTTKSANLQIKDRLSGIFVN